MSLIILFRYLHDSLSSPEVKELLQFLITLMSSSFEKGAHFVVSLLGISFSNQESTWQFWAELKDRWRACYKSLSLIHGWLLCWIASITRSLCFLTQFMSSYSPQFLFRISWIFKSKKLHFVFLTMLLNCFQSITKWTTHLFVISEP